MINRIDTKSVFHDIIRSNGTYKHKKYIEPDIDSSKSTYNNIYREPKRRQVDCRVVYNA